MPTSDTYNPLLWELTASPVPLIGTVGFLQFRDGRKLNPDLVYLPMETIAQVKATLFLLQQNPQFSDITYNPSFE